MAIGDYVPECPDSWSVATLHLRIVSRGRQFDRLGHVYLGDSEVWRTSTFEPTPDGTFSEYEKDITLFRQLLLQKQRIIVDIPNVVDDVYTGVFAARLEARFYYYADTEPQAPELIVPVSARRANEGLGSRVTIPPEARISVPSIPTNSSSVWLQVMASGNAREEFWWSNVPDEYTDAFPEVELLGGGSLRQVEVFVDEYLAGVFVPFPVVFTGGVSPGLWRPIVSISMDGRLLELTFARRL